jgi:Membrane bound beta barrel domain (DUF5777)
MKKYFWLACLLLPLQLLAQDTTINDLMKGMEASASEKKVPVKIFNSERAINANTTEIVGKGKMDFNVTHNFGDIGGDDGGVESFYGLDNIADVRIGFHIGLTDRLNLNIARDKGYYDFHLSKARVTQFYEIALKYQLLRQLENDPGHPVALTLFFNNVITAMNSDYTSPKSPAGAPLDTSLNQPYTFKNIGQRMSQVFEVIIAKKIGRVSLQLNPTVVHQGYVPLHDEQTLFALGAVIRVPLTKNMNITVDYYHAFRSKSSKDYFNSVDNSFNPPNDIDLNPVAFKFHDPLGVGLEILTAGHVFHLNFTNATDILPNRLIPYTTKSWGKGQYRWGFTISRKFGLWKEKNK